MNTHHFTLHAVDPPDLWERFDDLVDQFWDAGNDDATPGMSCGQMSIRFHREAASLEDAVRSAVAAVRSVGLEVDRVEIDRDDLAILTGEKTVADFLPPAAGAAPPAAAAA